VTLKGITGKDKWQHKIVELDPKDNDHVNNTGHFALQFALTFDPRRIFLLGFDMTPKVEDDMNYYNYPEGFIRAGFGSYIEKFDKFKGLPIYNCTPGSHLTQFEHVNLDDLL
jgi:hypothetical protein